jgi:hypothetical protein
MINTHASVERDGRHQGPAVGPRNGGTAPPPVEATVLDVQADRL